jgi:L-aminopeptidase/D-esterase-like protein
MERISINELNEFLVGQAQDQTAMTGCTAIIVPEGAVCGVDVRGGSPVTRDTDALDPRCNRKEVHAVVLSGGSSFGLDAAAGVMNLLEEKKIGRSVGVTVVPNVCCAILFDLKCGNGMIRPDHAMGRMAGENAFTHQLFMSGNFGAGTGSTLGTYLGIDCAMKGGIGTAAFRYKDLMVAAVIAVNCIGDIVENGKIIAGARRDDGLSFANTERAILEDYSSTIDFFSGGNTVIGCIMTNAILTKAQASKVSSQGHNAIARTIYPSHTINDGDTIFTMTTGKVRATLDAVGVLAAHAVQEAILDGVKSAETYGAYLSYQDLQIRKES